MSKTVKNLKDSPFALLVRFWHHDGSSVVLRLLCAEDVKVELVCDLKRSSHTEMRKVGKRHGEKHVEHHIVRNVRPVRVSTYHHTVRALIPERCIGGSKHKREEHRVHKRIRLEANALHDQARLQCISKTLWRENARARTAR
jgi:hypothetical protein